GRKRIRRLWQPATRTLLGAGIVAGQDIATGHNKGIDINQASLLISFLFFQRDQRIFNSPRHCWWKYLAIVDTFIDFIDEL
ncbi:MAG: hypothetical protein GY927_17795, partial [bacterium]|nr:hypothetical protein [bacterium]